MDIAIIANDKKKELIAEFCIAYCGVLSRHSLCATATTGKYISDSTGLEIERLLSGSHGGEQQIASRIAYDEVDILILFRDPSSPENYLESECDLVRLCDLHNIPVATNIATAEALIMALDRGDLDWRNNVRKKGIDQLLVSDPLSIRFLTGITVNPGERLYALLLRTSGKHTIFLNYLYYVSNTGFEEVWFSDMDDQIGVLTRHIDTKGVLGIDKVFPARFLIPLQERCPELKTVWGSDCVDGVRAVKNAEEIEIMKHSTEINDLVMERAAAYIKEGMTEKQIADFIDAEYLKEGASGVSFDTIVCFGANAADQHHTPSETRTLKAGECILIDMGCVWHGYCSDMTRTFYCKSVDDEQANIHDIVRTAVEKAEAAIKPGARFCDIDAQARDYIDEKGYSEYWKIRLGHFIGQEDHEYGDVSPINKNVAEPGMIFSIEPGIYIEGKYGVRVEDLVLVTEDGHEVLNKVEKKYRIVG